MAAGDKSLPLTKSVEVAIDDATVIRQALTLQAASLARYVKAQVPGSALHVAYSAELDKVNSLLTRF